ncbi:MAG: hypothetical protein QGH23_05995 [Dehalococcoidia bacterium]|nr:hypothetical protein [Dehalococcoidia bacterium]
MIMVIPSVLKPVVDSPPKGVKRTHALDEQLAKVIGHMAKVLAPLTLVTTRRQLDRELRALWDEYLHWKSNLWEPIAAELSEEDVPFLVLEALSEVLTLVKGDDKVLGRKEKELLTGVLGSLKELVLATVNGTSTEQQRRLDLLMECSFPLGRADLCVSTITLLLGGEIKQWDSRAIKLLCRAADGYMLEVEDIFLAHSWELRKRLGAVTETVSLDQLKKEIGLHS